MTPGEPNTRAQAILKRSKDSSFARIWKESFPRWRRRTIFYLRSVSRMTWGETTASSLICPDGATKTFSSLRICIRSEPDPRDVRGVEAHWARRLHPIYHGG